MRILLISSFFPPEILGGLEQSAYESALGLHGRGHHIEVLSCAWRQPGQSEIAPFPVHRILGFSNPSQYYGHSIRTIPRRLKDAAANVRFGRANVELTREFLKDKPFDLVAIWAFSGISTAVSIPVRQAGLPVVWHVGDLNLRERVNPHIVNRVIYSLVSPSWLRTERSVDVRNVLVNSQFMRGKFLEKGFRPDQLGVTYRAMDAALVQEQPSPRAQPRYLFLACRLIVQKGIEVCIQGLAALRAMPGTEDVELRVMGDGDPGYVASLRSLAESLGVGGAVKLLGGGTRAEVLTQMRQASIVMSSSTHDEGFGRVNIEAMSAATPLLASALDNVREIGQDGVQLLLYRPLDHIGLATQAHRILTEPGLAESLVAGGTARVKEAFTQNIIDAQIERYYERVLAGERVGD